MFRFTERSPDVFSFAECPALNVSNGYTSSDSTSMGSAVVITCAQGYTLFGTSPIACLPNMTWSDDVPRCLPGM